MVLGRFPVPPDSSPRTWRCHDGLTRLRLQDAQAPAVGRGRFHDEKGIEMGSEMGDFPWNFMEFPW